MEFNVSRRTKRLDSLLKSRRKEVSTTFITRQARKEDFYKVVLERIRGIEDLLYARRGEQIGDDLRIVYEVFPLIEHISNNLWHKNGRYYLQRLGYTRGEADVLYRVFRNGHSHTGGPYRLEYLDGIVTWGLSSGSGSGSPVPYDAGYKDETDPRYDLPAEKVFDYVCLPDGSYHASLSIDRLLAHIKYDIENRSKIDTGMIDLIVGQKVNGKRRRTNLTWSDD